MAFFAFELEKEIRDHRGGIMASKSYLIKTIPLLQHSLR